MNLGNYTSAPSPAILRQIVAEITKKQYLHSNIISELEVLKESEESDSTNFRYIRDIGYNPFYVIMLSQKQIACLKKCSPNISLYFDATGSIISSIPGQKRSYLYSIVVKPDQDVPSISVADMVPTQHTIPRIELFLSTLKREVCLTGQNLKVNHIETDFSYPLI